MKQLPAETEEEVELTPEQEDVLEESIAHIARGEFVTAKEMFDKLREIREKEGCMNEAAIVIQSNFDLSPEEEADLDAAIAEADAGLLTHWEEVLRRMRETSAESSEAS